MKILLADDHQMIIDGFKSILEKDPAIEVIREASDGEEVLEILKMEPFDVLVLDINMPKLNGIDVMKAVRRHYPKTKVLVLSMYADEYNITELLENGASGYILKGEGIDTLKEAVKQVYEGGEYIQGEVLKTYLKSKSVDPNSSRTPLTKRERQILSLIGYGKSTRQIADELFIAHSTVDTHRRNLIDKLGVKGTKDLIRFAMKNGYSN
mgnify:CR=1 FL=1